MKLWTVYLQRKSRRGRWLFDTLEAETAADAIKAAEAASPGYVVVGKPKQEETCT